MGLFKICLNDPIDLEFTGTKNVICPFKYINISSIYHTVDPLYLKLARSSRKREFTVYNVISWFTGYFDIILGTGF